MTKRQKKLREWDLMSEQNRGFHEAADIFPSMSDEEFAALRDDIAANGLQSPIMTDPDGMIIDGRHRWRACMAAKVEPRYQVHQGNPWTYVVSANLHRRHLTDSQRAMVGGRLAKRAGGQRTYPSRSATADAAGDLDQPTRQQAADLLHISQGAVERARRVIVDGAPELAALVEESAIPLSTAARVARLYDKDEQLAYVERVRRGEDPVKTAPMVGAQKPTPSGKRHHRSIGKDLLTLEHVNNIGSAMAGIEVAFSEAVRLDDDITPEAAKRVIGEIWQGYRTLRVIKRLLMTRAKE